jgi:membrane protein DedA with SNARE-associated domain/rhodanese-related sulfurtransferase
MSALGITPVIHFVEREGYALLFFWVLAEQGALPIPSVPLLIAVGALIRMGKMNAAAAVGCCLAGAMLADSVWFHLGRRRGKRILRFLCRVSLAPDSCVRQTENTFLKYGLNTLLIAKFIPGLNAVAAPLAGDSGVGAVRFLALDAVGIVIWSAAYMGVGYVFSGQLELAFDYVQRLGSGFIVVLTGAFTAWVIWKVVQRRRFSRQIEMARITPEELRDRVDAGEQLCILDLRSRLETDSSSFPGVIRLSAEDLTAHSEQLPRDREIILFCSCPNEASSARAALVLKSQGFKHVRPLRGGADAWEEMMQTGLTDSLPRGKTRERAFTDRTIRAKET